MANFAVRGENQAAIWVSANVATAPVVADKVVHWKTMSDSKTQDTIDIKDAASAGFKEKLLGDRDLTITLDVNFQTVAATNDLGLSKLIAAAETGIGVQASWYWETIPGAGKLFTNTFAVTSNSMNASDPMTCSFTLTSMAKPSVGTQPAL